MVTPDFWQTSRETFPPWILSWSVPGEISGHHTRTLSARRRRGFVAIHWMIHVISMEIFDDNEGISMDIRDILHS
jgi:hypothetical protein